MEHRSDFFPAEHIPRLDLLVRGVEPLEFPVPVHEAVRPAEAVDGGDVRNHGVVGVPLGDDLLPGLEVLRHPPPMVLLDFGEACRTFPI
jgi:hypothetical protein